MSGYRPTNKCRYSATTRSYFGSPGVTLHLLLPIAPIRVYQLIYVRSLSTEK